MDKTSQIPRRGMSDGHEIGEAKPGIVTVACLHVVAVNDRIELAAGAIGYVTDDMAGWAARNLAEQVAVIVKISDLVVIRVSQRQQAVERIVAVAGCERNQ